MNTPVQQTEKMYREHRTAVYHTALSFVRNPAVAEDVMQDVFLTFYEQLRNDVRIRNRRAWLLTVTRNCCRNLLRDKRREYPEENPPEESAEDPTQQIHAQDVVERLLSYLTEDEKLAFSLHYLDGYTYRELSIGLETPMGTLQTRCRTARKKLKQALKQEESTGKEADYDVSTIS